MAHLPSPHLRPTAIFFWGGGGLYWLFWGFFVGTVASMWVHLGQCSDLPGGALYHHHPPTTNPCPHQPYPPNPLPGAPFTNPRLTRPHHPHPPSAPMGRPSPTTSTPTHPLPRPPGVPCTNLHPTPSLPTAIFYQVISLIIFYLFVFLLFLGYQFD